jgi:hypothetical protein
LELVTAQQSFPVHDFIADWTKPLLPNSVSALGVQQIEPDGLGSCGRIKLDWDRN